MERDQYSPRGGGVNAAIDAVHEKHAEAGRQTAARQQVHQTAQSIADRVHGKAGTCERLVTWRNAHRRAVTVAFVVLVVAAFSGPFLGFTVGGATAALLAVPVVVLLVGVAVNGAGGPPRDARKVTSRAAVLLLDDGCTIETATESMLRAQRDQLDPYEVALAIRNNIS